MTISQIIIFFVLVEAIVENVKWTIEDLISLVKREKPEEGYSWNGERLAAVVLGMLFAFGFSINLFTILGFEEVIPFLGIAGTGLIGARGANYVSDLLSKVGGGNG